MGAMGHTPVIASTRELFPAAPSFSILGNA